MSRFMKELPPTYFLRELPLIWFLIGAVLACLCIYVLRRAKGERRRVWLQRLAVGAGILTVVVFVGLDVGSFHCFMPSTDGLEADIVSIAAASRYGQPIYHSPISPDYSYSTCYGPLTFLIYRVGLMMGGGRWWVLQAMVFAANLLICVGLYKIFRKTLEWWAAVSLMTLPLCQMIELIRCAYAMRADIWIMLSMVLGVQATLMESPLAAAVLAGLCAGLAVDFKVTAGIAGLILIGMVFQRSGMKLAVLAAAVAAATVLLPFALPGVSLVHYIEWLRAVGQQGIDPGMFKVCGAYVAFAILPLGIVWVSGFRRPTVGAMWRPMYGVAMLLGGVLAVAVIASKPGGGVWHFWQVIPILCAYVAALLGGPAAEGSKRQVDAVLILAWGGLAVALSFLPRAIAVVRSPQGATAEQLRVARQELEADVSRYAGRTVQMGYGSSHSDVESLRYLLIDRGQPYTLDGSHRLDVFAEKFPDNVLETMDHCSNDVWLIPHGERPFTFTYVFPELLHDTFVRAYQIERQGAALDAWVCKAR